MSGSINPSLYVNCTVETCPLNTSYYNYRVSLPANVVFVALFGLALIWFISVFIYSRRGLWFTIAMVLGTSCEIAGYAGRVFSWKNQWNQNAFLVQIICITIGPAFLSAGIYLCLGRIIRVYGEANSRIPAKWYARIFIPCDVVSLILQAAGGVVATVALQDNKSMTTGDNVMIAGLGTQVFTLLVFLVLAGDFAFSVYKRQRQMASNAVLPQDPTLVRIRGSWYFKGFMSALGLATILIFWRSVYRVAELNQGWTGPITFKQWLFVGMEPVLIAVAVWALCFFHPSLCLREAMSTSYKNVVGTSQPTIETNDTNSPLKNEDASKHNGTDPAVASVRGQPQRLAAESASEEKL
ncbi:hypothetical protein N7462_008515 [Penicillium macrosclerotiorum]|uniref:uncharacterized protein n=1 Tax=Penicillium macrosclerotiorum TaxID=303699 RepID=UPI00254729ED|nr:uncharacterized protein N7462_008515 [Penicillium macrosclerotiorum]KAJ5675618.1 hypothetical protein N7462_008515 [Penicillium macrosclerotiorum]